MKRTRCVCRRCGKINYLPSAGIDSSEPFLCEPCDDKFILWQEHTFRVEGPGEMDRADASLARFLRQNPIRQR